MPQSWLSGRLLAGKRAGSTRGFDYNFTNYNFTLTTSTTTTTSTTATTTATTTTTTTTTTSNHNFTNYKSYGDFTVIWPTILSEQPLILFKVSIYIYIYIYIARGGEIEWLF